MYIFFLNFTIFPSPLKSGKVASKARRPKILFYYYNKIIININYDRNKLISLKSTFNNIKNYYDEIEKIIDNMNIY